MIPDLFSSAAPTGPAFPLAATGAAAPAADTGAPAGAFADLLAESMATEAEDAVAPRGYVVPVSLGDLWLGLLTTPPQESDADDESLDAAGIPAAIADDADEATDDVPVDAASIAVPVIVQVPIDITIALAPVAPSANDATSQPTAAQAAPSSEPSALPFMTTAQPVERPAATRQGERVMDAAAEKQAAPVDNADVTAEPAPQAAPDADLTPVNVEAKPSSPGNAPAAAAEKSGKPAHVEARAAAVAEVKAAAAEAKVSTETLPQAPATVVTEQPQADAPAPETVDAPKPAAREAAPVKAQGQTAAKEPAQSSQAPSVPVKAAVAEQAAQTAQVVAAASKASESIAKNDAASSAEPHVTAAVDGVASAAPTQQWAGDTPQNGNGQQPPQDAPREILTSSRVMDLPVSAPVAVTLTERASGPVLEHTAPAASPFTPEQEVENANRLIESMRVQWRQGVSEATVRLNPQHLGEVTISIRVDRGAVTAHVQAETPAVQQWLESQQEKLRDGLAGQGLNLERFVVQRDAQQQRRDQRPMQQQARYRQPQEHGQRFEVTV